MQAGTVGAPSELARDQFEMQAGAVEVCAALLKYPSGEAERQLNSEIILQAIGMASKAVHAVFTPPSSSAVSARSLDDLKLYVGDLYTEMWDMALVAQKPMLSSFIAIPAPSSGFVSTIDHMAHQTVVDSLCFVEDEESLRVVAAITERRSAGTNYPPLSMFPLKDAVRSILNTPYISFDDPSAPLPQFENVVLGGTFDYLHNGHKRLLAMTAMVCTRECTIGVTSDAMLTKKTFASKIQPLETSKYMRV